jgi:5'-deoxynucleotidase YfbR-like HD superfamily hydrolase
MDIRTKLNLSYVPRWVIVPMTRPQSVAEHSWRVAAIAMELGERLSPTSLFSCSLVRLAVEHDMQEALTGDLPSSAKPVSPAPSDPYELIVKVADIIETRTWLRLWGHLACVEDVLSSNDPKFGAILDDLENMFQGGKRVALRLESEICGWDTLSEGRFGVYD